MWWAGKPGEFSAGGKTDSPTLESVKQRGGFALLVTMLVET